MVLFFCILFQAYALEYTFLELMYTLYTDVTGDIKSQATPTEAHSVLESRPTVSEPATHSLHTTTTTTASKVSLTTGIGKNSLGLSSQPIGAPTYIKHTTSSSLHLSSATRFVFLLLWCTKV